LRLECLTHALSFGNCLRPCATPLAVSLLPAQTLTPANFNVNCSNGGSVMKVLNAEAHGREPIVVHIKGVCDESLIVTRNDVTLEGDSPTDALNATSSTATVLTLNGSLRTSINQLSISGGNQGIAAMNGASFTANSVLMTGQAMGVSVTGNSSGTLQNSTVNGATQEALHVANGASLQVSGGTVENSASFASQVTGGHLTLSGGALVQNSGFQGLLAQGGGSIELDGATIEGAPNACLFAFTGGTIRVIGSNNLIQNCNQGLFVDGGRGELSGGTISNNGTGVLISSASSVLFQNGPIVQNNTGDGVQVGNGSSAEFSNATIQGNGGNGVKISDTSVASFGPGNNGVGNSQIINNQGAGLTCQSSPAVALVHGPVGTVSGNAQGNNLCPTDPW